MNELTSRQKQILMLLGEGRSVKEVSSLLGISPNTTHTHIRKTKIVLGLKCMGAVFAFAGSLVAQQDE